MSNRRYEFMVGETVYTHSDIQKIMSCRNAGEEFIDSSRRNCRTVIEKRLAGNKLQYMIDPAEDSTWNFGDSLTSDHDLYRVILDMIWAE